MTTAEQFRTIVALSLLATLAAYTFVSFTELSAIANPGFAGFAGLFVITAAVQFGLMRLIDRSRMPRQNG